VIAKIVRLDGYREYGLAAVYGAMAKENSETLISGIFR
jgi:hypothetical protein